MLCDPDEEYSSDEDEDYVPSGKLIAGWMVFYWWWINDNNTIAMLASRTQVILSCTLWLNSEHRPYVP